MAEKTRIYLQDLNKRVPLTVKMVLLTFVIGVAVWVGLDRILTYKLESIFHAQQTQELTAHAMDDYSRLQRYTDAFRASARLFVTQKEFIDHIEVQGLHAGDQARYHSSPPEWFPDKTVLDIFAQPRCVILLDPQGRVREVYHGIDETFPADIISPSRPLIEKSRGRVFIVTRDNMPYAVTSEVYSSQGNKVKAMVLVASPIDRKFLDAAIGGEHGHLVALLTSGADPRIMTSNDLEELPAGASPDDFTENYFVTGKELLDCGDPEIQIRFASFSSRAGINEITRSVIEEARHERATSSFLLILTFTLIMYWITRHIDVIVRHITDFSRETLGMEERGQAKGDQLHILRERFINMTREVAMSREIIKKQAEAQTRVIVDNAFNAIITTDHSGVVDTWNPRAEVLFGRPREEAVGKLIHDIIVPPQQHEDCRNRIKDIMGNGCRQASRDQIGITCYNSAGHEFPAELSVSQAGAGNKRMFIFIIRDITERVKAETRINKLFETVTKAKTEWETTFNSVNDMVLLVDKELNIIRCNRSFAEFVKKSSGELAGKKCRESVLCGPEWQDIITCGKIETQMKKTEVKTGDGRWLYVSHLPVFDEEGGYIYTIIMATDITELKNTQHKVMESRLELKERISELENFYEMAVNRELKMIALKKEIAKLKAEAQNKWNERVLKGDNNE